MTTIDIDPTANPDEANSIVTQLLTTDSGLAKDIEHPADPYVTLPGGLVEEPFGEDPRLVTRKAEVRELTGADEESIAKAMVSGSPSRIMQAILKGGTASLGEREPSGEDLMNLLMGDREALLMEIRRATYGDTLEVNRLICPHCGENVDLSITLDEIPMKRLDDPVADRYFEVPLRKGGKALVRLPNGYDVESATEDTRATLAEQNTVMLSKCVRAIVDANGDEEIVSGNKARAALIGLADRKKIIQEIYDRQPGPRYDEIKFTHNSCGKEVQVAVSSADLFRDL